MNSVPLNDIFHPRSIAVVGASAASTNMHTRMFLDPLLEFGYPGQIYPVNPKFQEVSGLKAYPNLRDIPGPVDHVISLVPAAATPQLLADCVAKQVKTIQLFTAGFVETGETDGIRLQNELVRIARSGGVRLLGPNCVGLYCPGSRISYCTDFPKQAGRVAFIAQSGGYTYLAIRMAAGRGVHFGKVISYGNAADVNEADLFEFMANDPETDIITAYIEGTKDGQRFLKVLTEAAARKPVIIIKKGRTEAGRRGTSSHTGALAGDDKVWDTALRQAGAIRVEDVDELVDMLVTFQLHARPEGPERGGGRGGGRGQRPGGRGVRSRRAEASRLARHTESGDQPLFLSGGQHAEKPRRYTGGASGRCRVGSRAEDPGRLAGRGRDPLADVSRHGAHQNRGVRPGRGGHETRHGPVVQQCPEAQGPGGSYAGDPLGPG